MILSEGKVIQKRKCRFVECICDLDTSHTSFMRSETRALRQKLHFCDKDCFKQSCKNGKFAENRKEFNIKHYGVENVSQREDISQQKSEKMNRLFAETDLQKQREDKCFEKHGVTNPYQLPYIRQKIKELYGDENPFKTEHGKASIEKTMLERFGVKSGFQLPKTRESCNSPDACEKRHQTMKRNGTYKKSKPEDKMYEILCEEFGCENVERQKLMNSRWPIDFYVTTNDTFYQYDSTYWHGLDRPIEVIAEHRTKRDAQIHKKWLIDREQGRWFQENCLTLQRVTSIQELREKLK